MGECEESLIDEWIPINEAVSNGNDSRSIDDDISKSLVELAKNISDLLENGRHTSVNFTFNDIKGDNCNDSATISDVENDNDDNESRK